MAWYEYVINAVIIFTGVLLGNFLGQKITEYRKRKKVKTNEN